MEYGQPFLAKHFVVGGATEKERDEVEVSFTSQFEYTPPSRGLVSSAEISSKPRAQIYLYIVRNA